MTTLEDIQEIRNSQDLTFDLPKSLQSRDKNDLKQRSWKPVKEVKEEGSINCRSSALARWQ